MTAGTRTCFGLLGRMGVDDERHVGRCTAVAACLSEDELCKLECS